MIIILEYSFFRISDYTCCFQGLNPFVAAAAAATLNFEPRVSDEIRAQLCMKNIKGPSETHTRKIS